MNYLDGTGRNSYEKPLDYTVRLLKTRGKDLTLNTELQIAYGKGSSYVNPAQVRTKASNFAPWTTRFDFGGLESNFTVEGDKIIELSMSRILSFSRPGRLPGQVVYDNNVLTSDKLQRGTRIACTVRSTLNHRARSSSIDHAATDDRAGVAAVRQR